MLRGRTVLIGLVWLYVTWLLGVPIAALAIRGVGGLASLWTLADFGHALWITLLLAGVAVIVNTVFGLAVAWTLARQRFRGRHLLNALIDLPFAVSPVVAGYMFILLFGRNGWLAGVSQAFDVKIAFALPGMALATIFVSLPFVVRAVVPVLQAVGTDQEEAARTLGASGWQTFWRVTLPSIRWGVIYGVSLTTARALGEFGAVFVVGAAIIGATETATIFIFRALDERLVAQAYAAALVLICLSIALLVLIQTTRTRAEKA